jgi:hypothetical protein
MVNIIQQQSAMRQAFCNMQIKAGQHGTHGSIINAAINSAEHGAGIHNVKDFNAHLKFSTFNTLKLKGVMA